MTLMLASAKVSKGCRELAGAVADQKPELVRPLSELGPSGCVPVGWSRVRRVGGGAENVDLAGVGLAHEEHREPPQRGSAVDGDVGLGPRFWSCRLARFPKPLPAPGVPVSRHRALHMPPRVNVSYAAVTR